MRRGISVHLFICALYFVYPTFICMRSGSQTAYPGSGVAMPTYSFCRQISTQEFEEQKLSVSQTALADLLENLIKDKTMSVKEKKKKLKLVFIYSTSQKHPSVSTKGIQNKALNIYIYITFSYFLSVNIKHKMKCNWITEISSQNQSVDS